MYNLILVKDINALLKNVDLHVFNGEPNSSISVYRIYKTAPFEAPDGQTDALVAVINHTFISLQVQ